MGRGHGDQAVAVLEEFLATRGQPLLHAAVLLAGSQEAGRLPPTRANLASLNVPVPAGFTRVTSN